MSLFKMNSEDMIEELDTFGLSYSFPVFVSLYDLSSFFSSYRNVKYGYAAVDLSNSLLLTETGLLSGTSYHELPRDGITSMKIKKGLMGSHTIDIKGIKDGKNYRFKLIVAVKLAGDKFPEQAVNAAGLIDELKRWA